MKYKVLILILALVCSIPPSFRDPVCDKQAGPSTLGCQSRIPSGWEKQEVWPVNILAKARLPWELPEGKHFPGAGRAGRTQGRVERPQWTLVWWFSLDSPTSPASGPGWALFSDLQPDPAPKQPALGPDRSQSFASSPVGVRLTGWGPVPDSPLSAFLSEQLHQALKACLCNQTGAQSWEVFSSNRLRELRTDL